MEEFRYVPARVFADGWVTNEDVKMSVTGPPDGEGTLSIKTRGVTISVDKRYVANYIGKANGYDPEEKHR